MPGGEAAALREEKETRTSLSAKMWPVISTSVEQSFLIKIEGSEGPVLHFTLDSLNPRNTADQFQSAAPSETGGSPCSWSSFPECSRHREKKKNHCKSLAKKAGLWKSRALDTHMLLDRYSWYYLWSRPKLAPGVRVSAVTQYSPAVAADWEILPSLHEG